MTTRTFTPVNEHDTRCECGTERDQHLPGLVCPPKLSVNLPPNVMEALQGLAEDRGTTVAQVLRDAITTEPAPAPPVMRLVAKPYEVTVSKEELARAEAEGFNVLEKMQEDIRQQDERWWASLQRYAEQVNQGLPGAPPRLPSVGGGVGPLVDPDGERYVRDPGFLVPVPEVRDPGFCAPMPGDGSKPVPLPNGERYRPELVAVGEFAMPESQDAADVAQGEVFPDSAAAVFLEAENIVVCLHCAEKRGVTPGQLGTEPVMDDDDWYQDDGRCFDCCEPPHGWGDD